MAQAEQVQAEYNGEDEEIFMWIDNGPCYVWDLSQYGNGKAAADALGITESDAWDIAKKACPFPL
jgi:hypothetical protein